MTAAAPAEVATAADKVPLCEEEGEFGHTWASPSRDQKRTKRRLLAEEPERKLQKEERESNNFLNIITVWRRLKEQEKDLDSASAVKKNKKL